MWIPFGSRGCCCQTQLYRRCHNSVECRAATDFIVYRIFSSQQLNCATSQFPGNPKCVPLYKIKQLKCSFWSVQASFWNPVAENRREQCLTEIKQRLWDYTPELYSKPWWTSVKICSRGLRLCACVHMLAWECVGVREPCTLWGETSGLRCAARYIKCSGALSLLNCAACLRALTWAENWI